MTCQCCVCKYCRKEITREEFREALNKEIVDCNKILADKKSTENDIQCAEYSKEEAEYMLYELEEEII